MAHLKPQAIKSALLSMSSLSMKAPWNHEIIDLDIKIKSL